MKKLKILVIEDIARIPDPAPRSELYCSLSQDSMHQSLFTPSVNNAIAMLTLTILTPYLNYNHQKHQKHHKKKLTVFFFFFFFFLVQYIQRKMWKVKYFNYVRDKKKLWRHRKIKGHAVLKVDTSGYTTLCKWRMATRGRCLPINVSVGHNKLHTCFFFFFFFFLMRMDWA